MPALKYWDTGSSSYVLLTPGVTTFPFTFMQTLTAPTVASSPYQINHNLNTNTPLVQIWDAITGQMVQAQVRVANANSIQVSVATNMPNNVNVIVIGSAQSPVPVNPADYASKSYVDARTPNLPAPVTSGSGVQSYTAPTGEVFVAANGVNSGVWKRATDVLHGSWYRNASWNSATGSTTFAFDTMVYDPYSIYTATTANGIVTPITGLWHFDMCLGVGVTAASWLACSLRDPLGNYVWGAAQAGMPAFTANIWAVVSFSRMFNAGDKIVPFQSASAVLTGQTGLASRLSFDYLGTG
jgi:hypothetical protein